MVNLSTKFSPQNNVQGGWEQGSFGRPVVTHLICSFLHDMSFGTEKLKTRVALKIVDRYMHLTLVKELLPLICMVSRIAQKRQC